MTEKIDLDAAIVALLRLAVAEREEKAEPALAERKIEVLLNESGLDPKQIAGVTGKNVVAVRKTLERARR